MQIKQVEEADFRSSELSLFKRFEEKNPDVVRRMKSDDIIVFVSRSGNQFLFVFDYVPFVAMPANDVKAEIVRNAIRSVKHRLTSGKWNPHALRNYLEEAGLQIDGIKRFEDHFKYLASDDYVAARKGK